MTFLFALHKIAPATAAAMTVVSKTPPTKLAAAAPAAMGTSTQPLTENKNRSTQSACKYLSHKRA